MFFFFNLIRGFGILLGGGSLVFLNPGPPRKFLAKDDPIKPCIGPVHFWVCVLGVPIGSSLV